MKKYGRVEVQFRATLILALDGGQWSTSRLGHYTRG